MARQAVRVLNRLPSSLLIHLRFLGRRRRLLAAAAYDNSRASLTTSIVVVGLCDACGEGQGGKGCQEEIGNHAHDTLLNCELGGTQSSWEMPAFDSDISRFREIRYWTMVSRADS